MKRKLADLYVRGKTITLDDGEGAVEVWVQKLNPVEHSTAIRKADAARARYLAIQHDKDSEEYQAVLGAVRAEEPATLIKVLSYAEQGRITPIHEAKIADEPKWKDDNYLEGLRDLWNDGLKDKFVDEPFDAEARRVHLALQEYLTQVQEEVEDELEGFRGNLETVPLPELEDMAVAQQLKQTSDGAWIMEYYRTEVALGTRDAEDHRLRVFETRDEVDDIQGKVFDVLSFAFRDLTGDPTEGKDSAAAPPSSPSSSPSEQEATEPSSGRKDAAA